MALRIFDLADDVEGGFVLVSALDEGDLRAGHDDGDGDVVVRVVSAEVERLQVDGDIGCGQVAGELVLELALAIFACGVLVVGGGVVAGAVFELEVGAVDLDGELAVAAVASRVRGAEAEDVVGRGVMLDALEGR